MPTKVQNKGRSGIRRFSSLRPQFWDVEMPTLSDLSKISGWRSTFPWWKNADFHLPEKVACEVRSSQVTFWEGPSSIRPVPNFWSNPFPISWLHRRLALWKCIEDAFCIIWPIMKFAFRSASWNHSSPPSGHESLYTKGIQVDSRHFDLLAPHSSDPDGRLGI